MKRINVKFALIFMAILLSLISNVRAATLNADSCSNSEIQNKVNAAKDGDIVSVPAGTCTWSSGVSWSDKNISVIGAGEGNTSISNASFAITANSKSKFRISGMTLTSSNASAGIIVITNSTATPLGSSGSDGFRVDHVTFDGQGSTFRGFLINGLVWGVIDHCTFNIGNASIFIGVGAYSYASTSDEYSGGPINLGRNSWEVQPLDLGGPRAVYIEDCSFNNNSGKTALVQDSWYGGRMVVRWCTIVGMDVFVHNAAGGQYRGGLRLEVYNNQFTGIRYSSVPNPGMIRAGTGVIFNNQVTGYDSPYMLVDNYRTCCAAPNRCSGLSSYDGNTSGQYGWPCQDQIGRGGGAWGGQRSEPIYAWNNGTETGCRTGGSCTPYDILSLNGAGEYDSGYCGGATNYCMSGSTPPKTSTHIQSGRDFVNNGATPKTGYTSYIYPHPLQGEVPKGGTPLPPNNLRIIN